VRANGQDVGACDPFDAEVRHERSISEQRRGPAGAMSKPGTRGWSPHFRSLAAREWDGKPNGPVFDLSHIYSTCGAGEL
jgi:hypothetical protein